MRYIQFHCNLFGKKKISSGTVNNAKILEGRAEVVLVLGKHSHNNTVLYMSN